MATTTFLPNGIYDFTNINWNFLDPLNLTFNSVPTDNEYDWGWGDYPTSGTSPETVKAQIQTEVVKGNFSAAKVLGAVLTYGPTLLQILSRLGKTSSDGRIDETTAKDILIKTNGDLTPTNINRTFGQNTSGQNTILGVPISYVALGLGGVLLYKLFKDDKKKKK